MGSHASHEQKDKEDEPESATAVERACPAQSHSDEQCQAAVDKVEGQVPSDLAPSLPQDFVNPLFELDCLLGPKQQKRALKQKEESNERLKLATKHWAKRWREYCKTHPEIVGADREDMKAAFDSMQSAEMKADTELRIPKAHFSTVMSELRRSNHREIGMWKGYAAPPSAEQIHKRDIEFWASKWKKHVASHPECIGLEREPMKSTFEAMQAADTDGAARAKAPFGKVMSELRRKGHREAGTWQGFVPDEQQKGSGGKGASRGARGKKDKDENKGKDKEGGQENSKECEGTVVLVTVPQGVFDELGAAGAQDLETDMGHLVTKTGLNAAEIQWEENTVYLRGNAEALEFAKSEMRQILAFYFPLLEPPVFRSDADSITKCTSEQVDDSTSNADPAALNTSGSEKPAPDPDVDQKPRHWSQDIECKLTQAQRLKTLAQTQAERERQRTAVFYWAEHWAEYVKAHTELIGAERATMKAGFDAMQKEAPPCPAGKAHFGLVMNFLRQSGRRTIGAWKDYRPKGWDG